MSRLIDADALEKVITEEWFLEIIATQNSKSGVKKNIVNAIDSAPTAFDVDKVVAMIDEALLEFNGGTNCTECVYKEICDNGYEGCVETMVGVCKGIVKAGGINENN